MQGHCFDGAVQRATSGMPSQTMSATFHGVRYVPWQDVAGRGNRGLVEFQAAAVGQGAQPGWCTLEL